MPPKVIARKEVRQILFDYKLYFVYLQWGGVIETRLSKDFFVIFYLMILMFTEPTETIKLVRKSLRNKLISITNDNIEHVYRSYKNGKGKYIIGSVYIPSRSPEQIYYRFFAE